jgi:aspartyl-tRNA(Asn)/glutamyl-tRNA(Gln) amidotransferase subunit C
MSLSAAEIKKISHLARIAIQDTTITSIAQNLNNILQMVDKIADVNVENIEPMAHPQNKPQRLRQDLVNESIDRELLQSIAEQNSIESGFYLVPKVIEIEE